MNKFDWQSVLWSVPNELGSWWTWTWSIMAFAAAVLLFLRTVMNERWSMLVFLRCLHIAGLFIVAVAALNSGWQRWMEPLFALSGLGMGLVYFFDLHRSPDILRECIARWRVRRIRPFGQHMELHR